MLYIRRFCKECLKNKREKWNDEKNTKRFIDYNCMFWFFGKYCLANYGGMTVTKYGWSERDYGLTFGIFLGCCLSVAVFSAMLYGFAELLEIQEKSLAVQQEIQHNLYKYMSSEMNVSVKQEKDILQDIESNLPDM